MKDLVALISEEPDAQTRDSQLDAINQLWLSSLPDLSWAKSGIHRKGTPGYSNDAMRAFARNMFHGGYHLAKLRYGDRLGDTLAQMQETIDNKVRSNPEYSNVVAQSVVDEMNARHKHVMNPQNTPVANALTGLGLCGTWGYPQPRRSSTFRRRRLLLTRCWHRSSVLAKRQPCYCRFRLTR